MRFLEFLLNSYELAMAVILNEVVANLDSVLTSLPLTGIVVRENRAAYFHFLASRKMLKMWIAEFEWTQ